MKENKEDMNRVCCVCQVSLDGRPLNPDLPTSHGYCKACQEAALLKINRLANSSKGGIVTSCPQY